MILHITTSREWEENRFKSEYTAHSLKTEGFIHCSTIKQTVDTANIFFKAQKGLVLLCIDEKKLISECKFEDPAGGGKHDPRVGNLFPHVYGPINLSAIVKVLEFSADKNGLFQLPEGI